MSNYRIENDGRVIYKYELTPVEPVDLKGCFTKVMHVGEQNGKIMIWLERSMTKPDFYTGKQIPREEKEERTYRFHALGTGWTYQPSAVGEHVGTVVMSNGYVWHIFMKELE